MDTAALQSVLPELLLGVGAMVLLMAGAFAKGDEAVIGRTITWLAIAVLLVAAGLNFAMEGTQPTFGAAFVSDPFTRFLKILMLVAAAVTLVITLEPFSRDNIMKFEYPVLMLLGAVGMSMMISANDLIALYLGIELHSLAAYVIAAFKRDDVRSSEAGIKYFVLGALASGLLLYGASLIYGIVGSTGYGAIAAAAVEPGAAQNIGLIVGLVFLFVALAFKIGAVPFHMWTPDVYQGAPTPVTAFFGGASKVASVALIVRFVGAAVPGAAELWQQIVIFLAIASMVLGAFAAIGQTNIKRLLAYSAIGHAGFLLVGLAANNAEGIAGVLIYLTIYVVMTLGAFACVLAMRRKGGNVETISDLSGLAKTDLRMASIFAVLMFSLAGIPPLAGFWAKWYVFLAAIKAGLYPLAVIGVVTSVIGAFYYLRIVKIMFFDEFAEAFLPTDGKTLAVMTLSAVFILAFVLPFIGGTLVDAATAAAAVLMPGKHISLPVQQSDFRTIHVEETASTNADAMRLAISGEPLPIWIIADRQTAGRGRAGRSWVSPPGNFSASVAFQCNEKLENAGQISLIAGISVIEAIRATTVLAPDVGLRLKWPNDILLDGAKAGGILVESTTAQGWPGFVAVVGIGVNLVLAPDDLGCAATALSRYGTAPAPIDLLKALHIALFGWLGRWQTSDGFAPIRNAWMDRAGPKGEALTINTNGGVVRGSYEGLGPSGALLATVDGHLREFSYGDVALGTPSDCSERA